MRLTCKLKFIEDYMSVTLYMMSGVRCPPLFPPLFFHLSKNFYESAMKPDGLMRSIVISHLTPDIIYDVTLI